MIPIKRRLFSKKRCMKLKNKSKVHTFIPSNPELIHQNKKPKAKTTTRSRHV